MPPIDIASITAATSQRMFRSSFETSFQGIQKTVINRINADIQRVIDTDNTPKRLADLDRESNLLKRNQVLIDNYHYQTRSNRLNLEEMIPSNTAAIDAFSADDDNTNLTANEVETITAMRDEMISRTHRLMDTVHPDIFTPYALMTVKEELENLKAVDVTAGVVDAEGSGSPSNNNRASLDFLTDFAAKLETALNTSLTAEEMASDISFKTQAKSAVNISTLTEISTVELQKREDEIADIKSKYGNILKAISLSFEFQVQNIDRMTAALGKPQIEPGSVMNLFA